MGKPSAQPSLPPGLDPRTLAVSGMASVKGARYRVVARAMRRVGVWILILLVGAGLFVFDRYQREFERRMQTIDQANAQLVAQVSDEFEVELSGLTDDLGVLAGLASLRTYLDQPSESHRQSVARDFANFAMAKRSYAQVRLLDVAGDEVVRINYDDRAANLVERSGLQSKGGRYYVSEALALQPGEVYVSALDLNIENGVVEKPPRPMLRLATLMQDSAGKRVGLLVLNYQANRLIDWVLGTFTDPAHRFLLVDDAGAFVIAPDPDRDWAFMSPGMREDDTFVGRFPEAAAALGLKDATAARSAAGAMHIQVYRYPAVPYRASQTVRAWLLVGWTPPAFIDRVRKDVMLDSARMWLWLSAVGVPSLLLIGVLLEAVGAYRSAEKESRQRLMSVFESAVDGIIMIDGRGSIEYFNAAAERLFGWSGDEIVGQNVRRLMPPSHASAHDDYLAHYHRTGNRLVLGTVRELEGRRKDGTLFPLELSVSEAWIGDRRVFTGFLRDITLRKQVEARIQHQAVHDALTELPNRRLLLTELDAIIEQARARDAMGALVVIDIDHFMTFNDVMGHLVGDKVLRTIAVRLQSGLRRGDLAARLDGDEFAVVLDNLGGDEKSAIDLAERLVEDLRNAIREPLPLNDGQYTLTASVGIALFPDDIPDPLVLLKRADIAKNRAKKTGRDAVRFYRADMETEMYRRLQVVQDLRRALVNAEFVLHYQPKLDAAANCIAGLEALIRWQHPSRGLLSPAEFIEQAEENGLISELGQWAIEQALRDLKRLDEDSGTVLVPHVAVNISPAHFYARDFIATVRRLIGHAGMPAGRLELEITENLMLDNAELAIGKMQSLHDIGVSLALDDFGTGYSSLSYFQKLPIDRIKIDRAFVQHVDCRPEQAAMVRSVLSLAVAKPVRFVAEGVETAAEFAWLKDHGCHDIQGFLFSRPLPIDALQAFLYQFYADQRADAGGAA
jgi:diguanylate cyclase (GGDEF)-like protein/PAS domain S-box-containing protein